MKNLLKSHKARIIQVYPNWGVKIYFPKLWINLSYNPKKPVIRPVKSFTLEVCHDGIFLDGFSDMENPLTHFEWGDGGYFCNCYGDWPGPELRKKGLLSAVAESINFLVVGQKMCRSKTGLIRNRETVEAVNIYEERE